MGKKGFDLDMADEYPDILGGERPAVEKEREKKREDEERHGEVPRQSVVTYDTIPFDDFAKVDLRVAKITDVSDVQGAKKPLWKLKIDVGELGSRTIVAGIRDLYDENELLGRQIIIVANLKPRSLAGIMSEGMLLAAEDGSDISLLQPDKDVRPGCKIG
jgi:methionine--tRNA ligase beta chain